jgi:hypothetical protein
MLIRGRKPVPDKSDSSWARQEAIADFWIQLRISDETGMTTWEELVPLERLVYECLSQSDLAKAESLTAKAMHLIAGQFNKH